MPVVQVTHTMPILPDKVYVIPPNRSLSIRGGHLLLGELDRNRGRPVAIDMFLRALAESHREHAFGVVLSGMGSDGTAGLACIRAMGGVAIAQSPGEAEEEGMPRSAIESGMADFVLPAAEIPKKLAELRDMTATIRQRALRGSSLDAPAPFDMGLQPQAALGHVLDALRARTGHDFDHYRRSTLLRRLERRLQVRGAPDLASYSRLLDKEDGEAQALMKDLLIGVTSFFRDPAAFEALDRLVLPRLFQPEHAGQPLRIWVAACSTGQEAYSLAMLMADRALAGPVDRPLQVFASDIDEQAIHVARRGLYPAAAAAEVPASLLQRYFTREADQYKARRSLREQILFTEHNLLHNPAFSHLELISCRNFLIYLNQEIHRRMLQHFHFVLRPGGYLMLGRAESIDSAGDLFEPVDAVQRIYRAKPAPRLVQALPPMELSARRRPSVPQQPGTGPLRRSRLFSFAEIHLAKAAELGPPTILLNRDGDILHVAERAVGFLRPASGEPSRALAALVLPELQLGLRAAIFRAGKSQQPATTGPMRYRHEADERSVDVRVVPFRDQHAEDELLLVQFCDIEEVAPDPNLPASERDSALVRQLDDELRRVRRQLQETMEQADASGDSMRIHIEEMQSTIEELHAGAAGLDAGMDSLRAANQELLAMNQDLRLRAAEAAKAHDDLSNLIASSGVATIFLDRAMRIQRYTPRIGDFFNVIPADVGRSLHHITNKLDVPQLAEEAARVFDTLQPMEREVCDAEGRHYIVRVHPYRTIEHRIEGAVMTFFDISSRRAAEDALRESEERFRLFVTASVDTLYKMSSDWSEMLILEGMSLLASTTDPSRTWMQRYIPEREQARVSAAIAMAIAGKTMFELEHQVIRSDGSTGWVFSRAVPLLDAKGEIVEWFGAVTDISGRVLADAARLSGK
jgi:two-component system CheB/CheR fusion protein